MWELWVGPDDCRRSSKGERRALWESRTVDCVDWVWYGPKSTLEFLGDRPTDLRRPYQEISAAIDFQDYVCRMQ